MIGRRLITKIFVISRGKPGFNHFDSTIKSPNLRKSSGRGFYAPVKLIYARVYLTELSYHERQFDSPTKSSFNNENQSYALIGMVKLWH